MKKILKKLKNNPFDESLKTHKLKGDLKEFYACSLDYQYRITQIASCNNSKSPIKRQREII